MRAKAQPTSIGWFAAQSCSSYGSQKPSTLLTPTKDKSKGGKILAYCSAGRADEFERGKSKEGAEGQQENE